MHQPDLQSVIRQYLNGHEPAFAVLVEHYRRQIFTLSFRLLRDEEEARDAAQETFIKVWHKRHTYKAELKFSTWLYRIASNECYDRLRKQKNTWACPDGDGALKLASDDDVEGALINRELAELINRYTEKLSPKQRLVFTLRDIEGLEVEEIETITGLSAAKIKSNLYLARQAIRNIIDKL